MRWEFCALAAVSVAIGCLLARTVHLARHWRWALAFQRHVNACAWCRDVVERDLCPAYLCQEGRAIGEFAWCHKPGEP